VFRQVESQLWPSLRNHIAKLGGNWEVTSGEIRYLHPNGNTSRIIGYSATDPGRAEGWHAEDHENHPLLMVVDEAKTVADPLFEAISRCQPTRLLDRLQPWRNQRRVLPSVYQGGKYVEQARCHRL
jgi:hypothetical protein